MEISCCYALNSIATYAPDVLKKFGNRVAPIAFLASQNDPDLGQQQAAAQVSDVDGLKRLWEEILAELTLSKLYSSWKRIFIIVLFFSGSHIFDAFDLCARLLVEAPSWKLKALSAKSIGVLVGMMDANLPIDKIRKYFLREIFLLITFLRFQATSFRCWPNRWKDGRGKEKKTFLSVWARRSRNSLRRCPRDWKRPKRCRWVKFFPMGRNLKFFIF